MSLTRNSEAHRCLSADEIDQRHLHVPPLIAHGLSLHASKNRPRVGSPPAAGRRFAPPEWSSSRQARPVVRHRGAAERRGTHSAMTTNGAIETLTGHDEGSNRRVFPARQLRAANAAADRGRTRTGHPNRSSQPRWHPGLHRRSSIMTPARSRPALAGEALDREGAWMSTFICNDRLWCAELREERPSGPAPKSAG